MKQKNSQHDIVYFMDSNLGDDYGKKKKNHDILDNQMPR